MKFTRRLSFKFSIVILPIVAVVLVGYVTIFSLLQTNMLETELRTKVDTYAISLSKAASKSLEYLIDSKRFRENDILNYDYQPITDPESPFYLKDANPITDPKAMGPKATKNWNDKYNAKDKPMRYEVPFLDYAMGYLTPMADSYLGADSSITYAVIVDKYGYVPAHNGKASKPITGNHKKDFAQSRVARFFKDKTQTAISQHKEKKILFKPYLRNMGGGKIVQMWDISYPIYVKGEHWGAARIGFLKETTSRKSFIITLAFYLSCIILLVIIFFTMYIPLKILVTKPLHKTKEALYSLAEGNLSTRCNIKRKDELGELANSMNNLSSRFEDIIMSVVRSVEGFTSATSEIAIGNQDLSQRTSEQASSLEEITAAIEEMTANIDTNLKNAKQANVLSGDIMKGMEDLNDSSQKMHEIIQVIDSISFETNLLALNASIEAARAGEAGKGFEVVATEVKELSQRSSSQAKEITSIIEESISKVEENVKLVEKIVDIINEITSSSKDQHNSSKQISTSISELNEVTQQNASLVEESAAASEEISSQAKTLKDEVSYFRSNENQTSSGYDEEKGAKQPPALPSNESKENKQNNLSKEELEDYFNINDNTDNFKKY